MSEKRKYEYLENSDSIRRYPDFIEEVPAVITLAAAQHYLPSRFGELSFLKENILTN